MKKVKNAIAPAMFLLYLITLVYLIVFKANIHLLTSGGIPEFRSISFELFFNGKETLLNIVVFVPVGLFLMLMSSSSKLIPKAFVGLLISLSFEIAQYIFMVGTSDLTDIVTNTTGTIAGIAIYRVIERVLKDKTKPILTYLCIPFTIVFCLFCLFIYK